MEASQGAGGFPPYVSSGKTPLFGLVLGLIAGAVIAPFLAVIYAFAIAYIPIVYLLFILTVVFGAVVGGTTGMVMHFFKVRSTLVVLLSCFLIGVFAWLVSWPPWIFAVFFRADVPIGPLDVLNPFFLVDALGQIYETGTWSVGRGSTTAVSGLMLGVVWLIEAGLIVGSATLVGAFAGGDRVFCEKCESWCTMLRDQALYDRTAADGIRDALAQRGDLAVLASAPPPGQPMEPRQWASLKLGFCPSCGDTNVVGLDLVTETVNSKGQTDRVENEHLPYVCISKDQMRWLREGLARIQAR